MTLALLTVLLSTMDTTTPVLPRVEPARLRSTVAKLSAFTTRNSLSSGVRDACAWLADEFRKIPGMQVEVMEYTLPAGRRVPQDTPCVEVVATLPGKTGRTLVLGGHIDSLNLDGDPLTARAPGANDDASGVAVTLEAARVLSASRWEQTIKFVAFSGEEQGLLGSRALAKRAKEDRWDIEAVLSNDTVGSSSNKAGQRDARRVRVFSEEGEGHNSRELARFIEWTTRRQVKGFGVKLVFRRDRFGRGGDHTPFVEQGFSAVRFVEVFEEYTRQHTVDDTMDAMDFGYLAQVARTNIAVLASLAQAGEGPTEVRIVRDQSHATSLTWHASEGVRYCVYWRETTSPVWEGSLDVGAVAKATIDKVNKDDHVFAVGAVGGVPVEAK